jgi:hypothetical protein
MKSLPYWIQRADFSATDHDAVDVAGALRAFDAHPWHEELKLQSELEHEGREYCPPGMGLVDPDGPILHVCPTADGRAMVHYHPKPRGAHTREGMLRGDVIELIHYFFHGHHDWILQKLGAA